jgi:hypothetical protein
VAKTYILLADNYVAMKDNFQAKATLQSIIDNYKGDDDILSTAKDKLGRLSPGGAKAKQSQPKETQPDTTKQETQPDTTKN